jgi:hypothetical protein
MDYLVLKGSDISELERQVKQYLNIGWKCQGGVSSCMIGYSPEFYQAMVK